LLFLISSVNILARSKVENESQSQLKRNIWVVYLLIPKIIWIKGDFSMINYRLCLSLFFILTSGCASVTGFRTGDQNDFGVLVMAHGGTAEWNQTVLDVIQESVRELELQGVKNIGVVRLFVSGESWYKRTEQILGLCEGAPVKSDIASYDPNGPAMSCDNTMGVIPESRENSSDKIIQANNLGRHDNKRHDMAFWRIETDASFALSKEGLSDATEMESVLVHRAQVLSHAPEIEDVLILAHGPGDDAENERWITKIDALADAVRKSIPFRRVEVQTLREDWPGKREIAEKRIRTYVKRATDEGGRAIVIPFRVQGFGPYAAVLEGLDYISNGQGLAPHIAVTQWIKKQAEVLRSGSFQRPVDL
jgi:hypothetical protein